VRPYLCNHAAGLDERADAVAAAVDEGVIAAVELALELVDAEDAEDQPHLAAGGAVTCLQAAPRHMDRLYYRYYL
jgi:hypothetical protein